MSCDERISSSGSIQFCTFMALNFCQADIKAQHQKSNFKNHLSIAVAKSSTTERPDRVYAKLGMPNGYKIPTVVYLKTVEVNKLAFYILLYI